MALVQETIRVVTTGANAGTRNFPVTVNTVTGAGTLPLSIPVIGTDAGTSTVQAFMDTHSLSSNQAEIAWQPTAGPSTVAIQTPFTIFTYSNNGKTRGWPGPIHSGI